MIFGRSEEGEEMATVIALAVLMIFGAIAMIITCSAKEPVSLYPKSDARTVMNKTDCVSWHPNGSKERKIGNEQNRPSRVL